MPKGKEVVESPCVRNCCLNDDDICLGCFRSLVEITRWSQGDDQERRETLEKAELRRKAHKLVRKRSWG